MDQPLTEIYVSTDVEADGPIPGPHSMLSFASAAYCADKTLVDTFTVNLETLPDAVGAPDTMAWWAQHPVAYAAARENIQPPTIAMNHYAEWLKQLPGKPIFVGYPAVYDFMFVHWYLVKFTGSSPFDLAAIDIRTMAMTLLKSGYEQAAKRHMPAAWFDDLPHTHKALDDAIAQGAIFCNMLAALHSTTDTR